MSIISSIFACGVTVYCPWMSRQDEEHKKAMLKKYEDFIMSNLNLKEKLKSIAMDNFFYGEVFSSGQEDLGFSGLPK